MTAATEVIHVGTAKELFEQFLMRWPEDRFNNESFDALLYRGVGDADFELTPTALRQDPASSARFWKIARCECISRDVAGFQHAAEWEIICRYYRFANRHGLSLPAVPDKLHRSMICDLLYPSDDRERPNIFNWPPRSLETLIGLAQHYGLPTRLLDWTTDPMVAIYFAAESALTGLERVPPTSATQLAIWSTTVQHLEFSRGLVERTSRTRNDGPFLVQPLRAGNPNLCAQKGVFTLCRQDIHRNNNDATDRRPLNKIVADSLANSSDTEKEQQARFFDEIDLTKEFFVKHTLPVTEAPKLLRMLQSRGYDAGRFFPGYDGAARAVMNDSRILE